MHRSSLFLPSLAAVAAAAAIACGGAAKSTSITEDPPGPGTDQATPPSVANGGPGMPTCGAGGNGTESCATSPRVAGGTFYRDYDGVSNTQQTNQATVTGLRVDKYEITVGRFQKQFVSVRRPPDGPPPRGAASTPT